jgi:hypothetical protein
MEVLTEDGERSAMRAGVKDGGADRRGMYQVER